MSTPTNEELVAEQRRLTRLRGFDPDVVESETFDFFTLAEARHSLFYSTRSNPIPVFLNRGSEYDEKIAVVIDMIRSNYEPDLIGHEDYPDWYFEGWVPPSGFAPSTTCRRIRMSVSTLGEREFVDGDYLHWQWIEEPVTAALPIDATIRKLGLNGRLYTLLRHEGLETINDVLEFAKRHDFSEISGFGPTLLANLKMKLSEVGYAVDGLSFHR